MADGDSLRAILSEWPHGIEIQISNPKIVLGNSSSKIIFSGRFDDSRIELVSGGVSKDLGEYKVESHILCGSDEDLETIGSMETHENEILVKIILPVEVFYNSVQLLKESRLRSVLHLECVGLKQEESSLIWVSDKNELSIKDASIIFLHH